MAIEKAVKLFLVFVVVSYLFCSKVIPGDQTVSMKKTPVISVKASSFEKDEFSPEKAIDGNLKTRWSSQWGDPQWIMLDLGEKTTINKIVLNWETAYAKTYQILVSEDGQVWYVVYGTTDSKGGKEEISFKPVSARYVRVYGIERATQWGYSLLEVEALSVEALSSVEKPTPIAEFKKFDSTSMLELAKSSPKTYYTIVPETAPLGYYPKWLSKQQNFWTLAGTKDSFNESVLCEDGTIEPFHKSFSFMPYLYISNKLITAADSKIIVSLEKNYIPIPNVRWVYDNLIFDQTLFAYGGYDNSATYVWYKLENTGTKNIEGKLFLTTRPFQANPPWMSGGFMDIFSIEAENNKIIKVNGRDGILALTQPNNFGAIDYLEGDIIDYIKQGKLPPAKEVYDPLGASSAALEYRFILKPNEKKNYLFVIPVDKGTDLVALASEEDFFKKLEISRAQWEEDLNKIQIDISDTDIINTVKSNVAYILIDKDGAALLPGSRNYKRTWMRDGAEMAVAFMRTGHLKEAREYIDWVAKRQMLYSGEVLPMINPNGSADDWGKTLKEYDSQGEFLFTVCEYYRFTHDKEFLKEIFPSVIKAAKFIEDLRNQRLTDEYKNTGFYGILPTSVSHEGFPPPGAHSYWDDWWALKGLKDAAYLAGELGKQDEIRWFNKVEKELRQSLLDSIRITMEQKKLQFLPSSAEGHVDACGNAIAVWPTEEDSYLSEEAMLALLDSWYDTIFLPERKDVIKYNFTPYEMRIINAYLVFGEKKKASDMFKFFMSVRRPKEWNHWAECVAKTYEDPSYLGDMPHGWIASIYINLVLNMFACEYNDSLLLGLGIEEKWLDKESGITVKKFPTHYGELNYTVKKIKNNLLEINISGLKEMPKGGVTFSSPLSLPIKSIIYNDKEWNRYLKDKIVVEELPARILIAY